MKAQRKNGIVDVLSNHSVDETVGRVESFLKEKGTTLFAFVDHSGEAAKVGMKMRPTKLLIFGIPKTGTPLMLAAPSIALFRLACHVCRVQHARLSRSQLPARRAHTA